MYNTRSIKDKNVDEIKRKSSKTTIIVKNHLAVKNKQIANTLSKAEREQKITYERTKPIKSENPNSFGIEYEIPILTIKKDDFKNLKNNGEYSKNILTLDAEPFISEDFRDGGKRDIYIEFISKPMRFNNLEFIKNDSEERIGGTIASSLYAIMQGVQILRIHNVNELKQSIKVFNKLIKS